MMLKYGSPIVIVYLVRVRSFKIHLIHTFGRQRDLNKYICLVSWLKQVLLPSQLIYNDICINVFI